MTDLAATSFDYTQALSDSETFQQATKMATFISTSNFVPKHFRGKPNDVLVALHLASRLTLSPFEVLNNVTFISDKPCFSATLVISLANSSGLFRHPINWKSTGEGDSLVVTAFTESKEGQKIEATSSMAMARKEGWTRNKKYESMPEHMLRYRSATFLVRQFAPQILMGLNTKDEVQDISQSASTASTIEEKLEGKV